MISDPAAAQWGLLVDYAMDMYTAPGGRRNLAPPPDPRLKDAWRIRGYITGRDALFRLSSRLQLGTDHVFYGFLAQSIEQHDQFVAVIRGTDGILEWIEDAKFALMNGPAGTQVETGFWELYKTMTLRVDDTSKPLVFALTKVVGNGRLTVVGHSLGGALATYLTLDLASPDALGSKVNACLFASPQTGDRAFVERFHSTVGHGHYQLFNYELDIVPRVPRWLGYETLPDVQWISPFNAQAWIRFDVECNHHVLSYCAMLDYHALDWAKVPREDQPCAACIRGQVARPPPTEKVPDRGGATPIDPSVEPPKEQNEWVEKLVAAAPWVKHTIAVAVPAVLVGWLGVRIAQVGQDMRHPIYIVGLSALLTLLAVLAPSVPEVWKLIRDTPRYLMKFLRAGDMDALKKSLPVTLTATFSLMFTINFTVHAPSVPSDKRLHHHSTRPNKTLPHASDKQHRKNKTSQQGGPSGGNSQASTTESLMLLKSLEDVRMIANTMRTDESSLQSMLRAWSGRQQAVQGALLGRMDTLAAAIAANTHESMKSRRQMDRWMTHEMGQTAGEYRDVSGHLHMELLALGSVKNMIRYESCIQKASRVAGPFATFTSAGRKALWNSFQARCGRYQSGGK